MTAMQKSMAVFSGSVNPSLACSIAKELGVSLGEVNLEKFANGEIYARYKQSIRGADVFLIQSIAGEHVNDALMELLIMADAAKRASARTVTAVITHYGYSRQDRKAAAREPITAKLVADMIETAGITRVMTIDLHQGQIQGFFNMPVDHLTALPILADYFKSKNFDSDKICVVSPDVGRAKAAKRLSDMLEADLAIMHKGRPGHNKAVITALIGDVNGKICIINDDMIDTGGTIIAAAETLYTNGAEAVYICCTHPIFSGNAVKKLTDSVAEEIVVCDTIPIPEIESSDKIKVVSVAPLFARAIANVYGNESVSELFDPDFAL